MRVKRPDLDGVVHPHENPTEARKNHARIPPADRGCSRSYRRTDSTPRRLSQWSEWTGIEVFRNAWDQTRWIVQQDNLVRQWLWVWSPRQIRGVLMADADVRSCTSFLIAGINPIPLPREILT